MKSVKVLLRANKTYRHQESSAKCMESQAYFLSRSSFLRPPAFFATSHAKIGEFFDFVDLSLTAPDYVLHVSRSWSYPRSRSRQ